MSASARQLEPLSTGDLLAKSLVAGCSALVTPPDVCLKINELVGDEHASIDQVAFVVSRDPSLTAKVLRLANSPYYGLMARVDTVSRAVMVLGMGEIQKLVLAICAVESFSKLSSSLTNMNSFWRHAIYAGLVAQALARRARILHAERLFVAGTLHDIGSLLINQRFPEIAERTIRLANGDEDELPGQEHASLGFDHAHLGGLMLESWHLPAALVDAVRSHHAPHRAQVAPIESAIVKIADTIANYSGTGSYSERVSAVDMYDASLLQQFGVTVSCSNDELMDEVDPQFIETIFLLAS